MPAPTPNVVIFSERPVNGVQPVINTPRATTTITTNTSIDTGYVDKIRHQPLPNEIETKTTSPLKTDIGQMVKLLGGYCSENNLDKIKETVTTIHDTLNAKTDPQVKGWTRLLLSLHPSVDQHEKTLDYWKKLYSESMGTNTVLYYVDNSNIDLMYWPRQPANRAKTNRIQWSLVPWDAPIFIREGLRQKLEPEMVEYIQNAGHSLNIQFTRNTIFDAWNTTKRLTGLDIPQERPIPYTVAHGVSLNNDWYHQIYRIINGDLNKNWGKEDIIYQLDNGGHFVHVLINHLVPLTNSVNAADYAYQFKSPLGIETDTFPHKDASLTANVNQSGERVLSRATKVTDVSLKPKVIEYSE